MVNATETFVSAPMDTLVLNAKTHQLPQLQLQLHVSELTFLVQTMLLQPSVSWHYSSVKLLYALEMVNAMAMFASALTDTLVLNAKMLQLHKPLQLQL
jgi:hypothetical protein